ncbi:MAG: hypothetical protein J5852_05430 [Clostridia bacterium]|nr:hypothetical protein [Clostridia bacterium]
MKKRLFVIGIVIVCLVTCLTGCSVFDADYGKSEPETTSENPLVNVTVPEIMSDDENMPTYFDISLYDEENYADIYLGDDYEYRITYSGSVLNLPVTYKQMVKDGWELIETDEVKLDSQIMARRSAEVQFKDSFGKEIKAVFYNKSNSSEELISCPIVKFIVAENSLYKKGTVYGQFWINGVSNESAITDVIEYLGAPSHFYAVNKNSYYLDYFLTERDKRSKIRIYINLANDCVTRAEVSLY